MWWLSEAGISLQTGTTMQDDATFPTTHKDTYLQLIEWGLPIVDTRLKQDFVEARISGSVNIPFDASFDYRVFELPPRHHPLVFVCAQSHVSHCQYCNIALHKITPSFPSPSSYLVLSLYHGRIAITPVNLSRQPLNTVDHCGDLGYSINNNR